MWSDSLFTSKHTSFVLQQHHRHTHILKHANTMSKSKLSQLLLGINSPLTSIAPYLHVWHVMLELGEIGNISKTISVLQHCVAVPL